MGVSENSVSLNPMVLLIIIPFLNGYFIGNINPTFSGPNLYFFINSSIHQLGSSHHPQKEAAELWCCGAIETLFSDKPTLKTTQGEAKPKPSGAPLPDLAHDRRLAREVAGGVARPGATGCSTQLQLGPENVAMENPLEMQV